MASPQPASPSKARRVSWKNDLDSCPIVALGASAGGFAAVSTFLGNLSADTGLAFVLVQHLDPHHQSHLVPLLGKVTKMQVLDGGLRVIKASRSFYKTFGIEPHEVESKKFDEIDGQRRGAPTRRAEQDGARQAGG